MFIATSVLVASQAPEERHVCKLGGGKRCHMPLLRSLAGVVQFVTDGFNHTPLAFANAVPRQALNANTFLNLH